MWEPPKKNSYKTMTQIAAAELKKAILNGVYKPGEKLVAANLEDELNLGRVAIREALRELAALGLVASVPNKGSIVAERLDNEEVVEIYKIRYQLEGKAAYLAAQKITRESLMELEKIHKRIYDRLSDPQEFMLLNRDFHLTLYSASGWKFLCQIITQIYDVLLVFRNMFPFPRASLNSYVSEHGKILDSLTQKDPEKTKEEVINHIYEGFENLVGLFEANDLNS